MDERRISEYPHEVQESILFLASNTHDESLVRYVRQGQLPEALSRADDIRESHPDPLLQISANMFANYTRLARRLNGNETD